MSDYRINFGRLVELSDTGRLGDLLDIVNEDDELFITIASVDPDEVDAIYTILDKNNFEIATRGGHDGEFKIVARRKG